MKNFTVKIFNFIDSCFYLLKKYYNTLYGKTLTIIMDRKNKIKNYSFQIEKKN